MTNKIPQEKFKCAVCKGIFEKGLTDEEAKEQYKKEFPNLPFEDYEQNLVCDDCYKKMFPEETEEDLK